MRHLHLSVCRDVWGQLAGSLLLHAGNTKSWWPNASCDHPSLVAGCAVLVGKKNCTPHVLTPRMRSDSPGVHTLRLSCHYMLPTSVFLVVLWTNDRKSGTRRPSKAACSQNERPSLLPPQNAKCDDDGKHHASQHRKADPVRLPSVKNLRHDHIPTTHAVANIGVASLLCPHTVSFTYKGPCHLFPNLFSFHANSTWATTHAFLGPMGPRIHEASTGVATGVAMAAFSAHKPGQETGIEETSSSILWRPAVKTVALGS